MGKKDAKGAADATTSSVNSLPEDLEEHESFSFGPEPEPNWIKYYVKMLIYFWVLMFVSLMGLIKGLLGVCGIGRYPGVHLNSFTAWLLDMSNKWIFRIKIDRFGTENLMENQPCVYIANHQSSLDLFLMGSCWPPRAAALGKKSLVYIPLFGWYFYLSGNILVDRFSKAEAFKAMDQCAEQMIENDVSVWIYPEGTRHHGRGMLPFKKGAFHVAVKAQVPIVPVVFSPFFNFYSKKKGLWNSGQASLRVLKPIPTKGLTKDDINDLVEKARNSMLENYNEMVADLEKKDK
eukprot:Nk52_evm72s1810 gene=Nk52_evmTU72s1810